MAVNSFDDVLNSLVTDESDRGVLGDLANKYPGIKEGWLRQSDYSRKLDAFRDTEKKASEYESKFNEVSQEVTKWNQWAAENWDPDANVPKMERYWRERAEELEGQIGTDMTFDDINKFITEKGVVTKTNLDEVLNSKAEEINKNFQGSAYFAAVIAEKQGEHISEFNKPLKVRDFVAKLSEYGTNDLDAAYEKYVFEDRKSLAEKAKEREIEQIRAEERKKAEEEFATRKFNNGLPVDQEEPGLGHLEAKMRMVGDPDALEKAVLGSGTVAQIAAQQYRKDKLGISQS
jgi:hypothetical protein